MKTLLLTTVLSIVTVYSQAQDWVYGTVTDQFDTMALMDANIINLNTLQGAVTDVDGNFKIEANIGDTMEITYIGFEPRIIQIENKKFLKIGLEMSTLDEVLILAHGVRRECKTICYCFSNLSVESEEENHTSTTPALKNSIVYPNPSSGVFNLTSISGYDIIEINISDMLGRSIFKFDVNQTELVTDRIGIDLSSQPSGIYILNVLANGKKLPAHKLVKN